MNILIRFSVAAVLATAAVACAPRQHKVKEDPAPPQHAAMPSEEDMKAAFVKMSTPTPEHAILKKFAGKWKVETKWWMAPGTQPEVTKGTAIHTMIFGGKFLKQEFHGKFMGKPFDGLAYLGYDTIAEEFTSVWLDSMGTSTMSSIGAYNEEDKSLTFMGLASCPLKGREKQQMKSILRFIDSNHIAYEMHGPGPDGKLMKGLEVSYVKTK